MVSIGRTAIGYKPSRIMRNVNPYAKYDDSAPQNYRAYSNVAAFRAPPYVPSLYENRRTDLRSSSGYASNPFLTRDTRRFDYQVIYAQTHQCSKSSRRTMRPDILELERIILYIHSVRRELFSTVASRLQAPRVRRNSAYYEA